MQATRRDFFRGATFLSLAPTVPGFLAESARGAAPVRDGRVLVVVQLDGGNDGINTLVPFRDEGYARHRKVLRLPEGRLVKLDDRVGLHPEMGAAARLLETCRLAIVQGVGYPNPSRSHFRSMDIWQTARFDPAEHEQYGWLGRALDEGRGAASTFVGGGAPPVALRGRRCAPSAIEGLEDYALGMEGHPERAAAGRGREGELLAFVRRTTLDAYAAAGEVAAVARARDAGARYPESLLGGRLRLVARLLKAGVGSRIFYTSQSSRGGGMDAYDTHAVQLAHHGPLLGELSEAIRAFLDDLAAAGLAERVAVLCFSEFGRRPAENASQGTDHGTAGPVLLAGPGVCPGLVGEAPSLIDLDDGDLRWTIDFRRVYATVLDRWLGLPSGPALGGRFEPLPLFRT
jgi:uncharacterized protein (DUF1501 family)